MATSDEGRFVVCVECGRVADRDEVTKAGTEWVCYKTGLLTVWGCPDHHTEAMEAYEAAIEYERKRTRY